MKIFLFFLLTFLSIQINAQPVSFQAKAIYEKVTQTASRYDIMPAAGNTIIEIYYIVKTGIFTIYEARLNNDSTLDYIIEIPIPLSQIQTVQSKKIIVGGGGDPDYRTRITLKKGKKVTSNLYGDAEKPVKKAETTIDIYFSEMNIARSFGATVKNYAKLK